MLRAVHITEVGDGCLGMGNEANLKLMQINLREFT
jgi:hypothetical protein